MGSRWNSRYGADEERRISRPISGEGGWVSLGRFLEKEG
jgi:hypothetical protein